MTLSHIQSQLRAGGKTDKVDTHPLGRNKTLESGVVDLKPSLATVCFSTSHNSDFFKIKLKLIFRYLQNLSGLDPTVLWLRKSEPVIYGFL